MSVGKICVRTTLIAEPDESVRTAAGRMAENDVGTLVVVDAERRPVGVLTDRDIAIRCVAADKDPAATPIRSVMTAPVLSVSETTPIETALERMAGAHTRRLSVIDAEGRLVGILALDDVLELLVEETESIGRILAKRRPPAAG